MAELPPNAKALLALARDADDPPADAKARVHRAALLVIAAGGHALSATASASSLPATLRARFWGAVTSKAGMFVSSVLLVGSTWTGFHMLTEAAAPRRAPIAIMDTQVPEQQPSVEPLGPPTVSPLADPEAADEAHVAGIQARRHAPRVHEAEAKDTLAEEMLELRRASAAIEAGRAQEGLRLLARYRARFEHPALAQESTGLAALAECQLDPSAAAAKAKSFLADAPTSVLASRVRRACKLEVAR